MSPAPTALAPPRHPAPRTDLVKVCVHRGANGGVLRVAPAGTGPHTHMLTVRPGDVYVVIRYAEPALDPISGRPLPDQPVPDVASVTRVPNLARAHRLASTCSLSAMKILHLDAAGQPTAVGWAARLVPAGS